MENFIVSARKYRPDTFETVVGQGSITQTLKNAIKSNHLAQAYLFCGPRGVGKTTCARIFAKTINCKNQTKEIEACNKCESCTSFNESRSYNIHELDAASNNSVEDIRNLIDQVRIPPQIGKYSVYIIDEVHMLSQAAFNAFLKTLEEPPAHAVFILATTEKHKIIPTILSRCQIFDFNRIKIYDIALYLEKIAKTENITFESEALHIIAQKADGAMRDALSIFDQVVSFSENNITYKKVIENLNVLDTEYYFSLIDAFISNDVSNSLLIYNDILDKGFDGHQFINGLSAHIRDILVCKDPNTIQLLEVSESMKERYQSQANQCSRTFLYNSLAVTNTCDINYKISNNKRLHVELALIKLANITAIKKKAELEETTNSEVKPKESKTSANSNDLKNSSDKETKHHNNSSTEKNIIKEPKPSLSIKSALNSISNNNKSTEEESTETKVEPQQNSDFDQTNLIDKWNEFANSIKTNEPRLFSTLTRVSPNLLEDYIVEYKVANKLQEDAISGIKNELLHFLKNHLKNNTIELKLVVEEAKNEKKLYTQEDKFKHMADKNNELTTMKQRLKLDFD